MNRPPSIRIAFRTLGRTVRHGYDNLGTLLLGSILWGVIAALAAPFAIFAFRAPSVGSALLFLIAIMILPISPATASLHRITQRMTEERASSWSMGMFWENFRRDWGWSSRLVLTLMVGFLLVAVNEQFYIRVNNAFIPFLSVLFLVFLIVWLGVILFAVPLALRQDHPHLRTTMRNTLIIVLANLPGVIVSLVLLFITSLIFLLPPLFLLLPGWVALWSEENVRLLLVSAGIIPEDEIADRPHRFG